MSSCLHRIPTAPAFNSSERAQRIANCARSCWNVVYFPIRYSMPRGDRSINWNLGRGQRSDTSESALKVEIHEHECETTMKVTLTRKLLLDELVILCGSDIN